jgi:predicted DNA binding CopG/RHH family protein
MTLGRLKKSERISCRFTHGQHQAIKAYAKWRGLTWNAAVEELIAKVLQQAKP